MIWVTSNVLLESTDSPDHVYIPKPQTCKTIQWLISTQWGSAWVQGSIYVEELAGSVPEYKISYERLLLIFLIFEALGLYVLTDPNKFSLLKISMKLI